MANPNLKRHSPKGLVNHGPGKGDKSRHKLDDSWRANYDAIDWGRKKFYIEYADGEVERLHASATKIIRRYGKTLKALYSPDLDTQSQ